MTSSYATKTIVRSHPGPCTLTKRSLRNTYLVCACDHGVVRIAGGGAHGTDGFVDILYETLALRHIMARVVARLAGGFLRAQPVSQVRRISGKLDLVGIACSFSSQMVILLLKRDVFLTR